MPSRAKILSGLCGLAVILAVVGPSLPAAAASSDISGSVTQSYNADPSVLTGMVVELKSKNQTVVTPLTSKDIRSMLGVVIPTSEASIILTPQSSAAQQVLIAASGKHNVLVSNQAGPIKTGDYLTISSVSGIAMKASATQPEIIGQAIGNFNNGSSVVSTMSLKGSLGRTTTVSIGFVTVNIRLTPNPLFQANGSLPGFLSRVASSVTNKPVSPVRVYLSLIILAGVLFTTGGMFYSTVRNGLIAIGRNPLARRAISLGIIQVMISGLVVLAAGILAIYLILN